MSQIGIIVRREFNERVRKKSFIIVTLLMPILMGALMAIPALIVMFSTSETRTIAVIDDSGVIMQHLKNSDAMLFETTDLTLEQARADLVDIFAVLHIDSSIVTNPKNVKLYTNSSSSVKFESKLESKIERAIENERISSHNIDDLRAIMESVKASVSLQTLRNDESMEGESQIHSSALSTAMGYGLGFVLYMFLMIYGSMVMMSVIEEKSSRVLEILVSSVSPFKLMLGKILGIASVAITQIAIWGILLISGLTLALPNIIPAEVMETAHAMQQGATDVSTINGIDAEMLTMIGTLTDVNYIIKIISFLLLFTIGGYLLYSAMFAAVGSAVDNAQDAQQLQTPVVIPIIIGIVAMMTVMEDPNSSMAFWFSIIPFTSPIVMLARIPYDIPTWEIVLSLVILYSSFIVMVWFAGKVYRVGILMYGKKPSFKELYKWMRYKY